MSPRGQKPIFTLASTSSEFLSTAVKWIGKDWNYHVILLLSTDDGNGLDRRPATRTSLRIPRNFNRPLNVANNCQSKSQIITSNLHRHLNVISCAAYICARKLIAWPMYHNTAQEREIWQGHSWPHSCSKYYSQVNSMGTCYKYRILGSTPDLLNQKLYLYHWFRSKQMDPYKRTMQVLLKSGIQIKAHMYFFLVKCILQLK